MIMNQPENENSVGEEDKESLMEFDGVFVSGIDISVGTLIKKYRIELHQKYIQGEEVPRRRMR